MYGCCILYICTSALSCKYVEWLYHVCLYSGCIIYIYVHLVYPAVAVSLMSVQRLYPVYLYSGPISETMPDSGKISVIQSVPASTSPAATSPAATRRPLVERRPVEGRPPPCHRPVSCDGWQHCHCPGRHHHHHQQTPPVSSSKSSHQQCESWPARCSDVASSEWETCARLSCVS